ncbi:PREDICTED: substance-K receptor [Hipposideros armiger]|uniref:Substance-K receptor n=1 Tax=Hipposideros armiger TaxID=186990 RepID=A0A8B7PWF4_HIPAR|nr:PREDICTED: substance-K receptor [Hipposideros armiger]
MGACAIVIDANISSGLESNTTGTTVFSMPGWQLALWAAAYLTLVLVAVTGNATVIWIILAHPRMRTVTNYFLVNLALADLCMAAFNAVFNFIYASHNIWYFGRAFCYFQNLFPITAMFVSIYSMTAIAADRQEGAGRNWGGGALAHFARTQTGPVTSSQSHSKLRVEPRGCPPNLIMIQNYAFGRQGAMEPKQVRLRLDTGRTLLQMVVQGGMEKFVKTMVLVVVIFAICWLPYHLYFILGSFQEDIYCHKFIQQVYLAIFWLAMSSTMYNPIIYCCLNRRFRSGFRIAFRCCPWVTPTQEDKIELTHTPSLSRRVNRCHTKETLFMNGDVAPSEATSGQMGGPPDGASTEL